MERRPLPSWNPLDPTRMKISLPITPCDGNLKLSHCVLWMLSERYPGPYLRCTSIVILAYGTSSNYQARVTCDRLVHACYACKFPSLMSGVSCDVYPPIIACSENLEIRFQCFLLLLQQLDSSYVINPYLNLNFLIIFTFLSFCFLFEFSHSFAQPSNLSVIPSFHLLPFQSPSSVPITFFIHL